MVSLHGRRMSVNSEVMVLSLQESVTVERRRRRRRRRQIRKRTAEGRGMERVQRESRWRSLRERLGFKVLGCCGTSWGLKPSDMAVRESDDEEDREDRDRGQEMEMEEEAEAEQIGVEGVPDPGCVDEDPPASGMNLATALAAERHLRATQDLEGGNVEPTSDSAPVIPAAMTGNSSVPGTPLTLRVSLMKLLEEEGDGVAGVGVDGETDGEKGGGGEGGADGMCCVCMGRRKGAAFIPCGHTFCRVCSRELWLNRGSCPLCNRSVLEILDIF